MANDIDKLIAFYKAEICDYIDGVKPYQPVEQLKQFASLFSPGLFYFYVINFANLRMEYVDPGCRTVLGVEPEDLDVPNILSRLSPEELAAMTKKEALVVDFLFNYLKPEQLPFYKIVYFLRLRDNAGKITTILHQAAVCRTKRFRTTKRNEIFLSPGNRWNERGQLARNGANFYYTNRALETPNLSALNNHLKVTYPAVFDQF